MQNKRLEQLKEFLVSSPGDSFLIYAIATEYAGMGDDQKALEHYKQLLELHPAYVATYYHLGKLYERHGEREKAEDTYKLGMEAAQKAGDQHSLSELKGAFNSLIGIEEEEDY
jgi:tetratricopeptide (TPR) repeat protein